MSNEPKPFNANSKSSAILFVSFQVDRRSEWTGIQDGRKLQEWKGGGAVQILKIPPPQSSPVDIRFDFGTMCDRSFPACDLFGVFVVVVVVGFVFVVVVVFCFGSVCLF